MQENTNIETAISDTNQVPSETLDEEQTVNKSGESAQPDIAESEPFLEIKYLKQKKALTKEQAKDLAEQGMHYANIKDRLEYLAALQSTTPKQFLDSLIKENDLKIEQTITDALGQSELSRELTQLYKEKTNQRFNDQFKQTEQANINLRIADEFIKMQEDFGDEIKNISDIPESVIESAKQGLPLPYAFLLNKYLTEKATKNQQKAEQSAAENSVGPVSTDQTTDPVGELFLKSLWGR